MTLKDWREVAFGMWIAISAMWALLFVAGCAAGDPDGEKLLLAVCCVVVCQLYWRLWNEKAPELHIEIFKLPDGREIRKEYWE